MIRKKVKIKDLGTVITGKTPPTKQREYYGDEYTFIKPTYIDINSRFFDSSPENLSNNAYEKYKNSFIPPYSTCVVTIGSIGEKICMNRELCLTNQAINTVIPDKENYDNMFIFYLLKNNLHKVKGADTGTSSGRENVGKSIFENIEVEVPDLDTQIKIGKLLSSYDDLIENNFKRIKLLEESIDLIYKEWFVNLRFPEYEKFNIVDGIPEGWVRSKVNNICEIKNGYAFKSKDYSKEDGIELVRTRDFSDSVFIDRKEDIRIPNNLVEKYEKYLLNDLDFLLIMVGASIGKYGIVLSKDLPSLQNQNMWSIYTKDSNKIPQTYIIGMMKNLINLVLNFRTGAARDFFRKDHLGEREVLVPHSNLLNDYDRISRPIYNQINKLLAQNEKLKEARDILIPRLISGEIEV